MSWNECDKVPIPSEDSVCSIVFLAVSWLTGFGNLGRGGDWISFPIVHEDGLLSVRTVMLNITHKCPSKCCHLFNRFLE